MRSIAVPLLGFLTALGVAQAPDLSVRLDFALTYHRFGDRQLIRSYDPFGRMSKVTLRGALETGFKFQLSQKLGQIPNDADQQPFEEYFLEDEGIWRIGKQQLPFGTGVVYRENALAARADTSLLITLPVSAAVVDNGKDRQSGVSIRVGNEFGVSAAIGSHFGINASSFTLVRHIESALGTRRGYKQVLGFDGTQRIGPGKVSLEYVSFLQGMTDADRDEEILDLRYETATKGDSSLILGATYSKLQSALFLRAQGRVPISRNLVLEPFVRVRDGKGWDFGLGLRVKL